MNINIKEKIEEIRQQPENIRIRYVWGCVIASMIIIATVWFFSIAAMFRRNSPEEKPLDTTAIEDQFRGLRDQASNLKDLSNQPSIVGDEGIANSKNTNNSDYFSNDDSSEIPASGGYSDLQKMQE